MTEPAPMPREWYHPYAPTLSGDLRWVTDAVFVWAGRDIEERTQPSPILPHLVRAAALRLQDAHEIGTLARRLEYGPHHTCYTCVVKPGPVLLHRDGMRVAVEPGQPGDLRVALARTMIFDYTGDIELAIDQAPAYARYTKLDFAQKLDKL